MLQGWLQERIAARGWHFEVGTREDHGVQHCIANVWDDDANELQHVTAPPDPAAALLAAYVQALEAQAGR